MDAIWSDLNATTGASEMKNEIRRQTALIVRRNGEYLVGRQLHDGPLVWSVSAWDAFRTRDREKARRIAAVTGGIVVLFNPIIGRTKTL